MFASMRGFKNEVAGRHQLGHNERRALRIEFVEMSGAAVVLECGLAIVNLIEQDPIRFAARLRHVKAATAGLGAHRGGRIGVDKFTESVPGTRPQAEIDPDDKSGHHLGLASCRYRLATYSRW